jgi:hypothetical protein
MMTLTLELTPEEARRVELARQRGFDITALLKGVIASLPDAPVIQGSERPLYETATREEWEAFMDALAEGGENLPVLPPEAYDRESLYEDRV